MQFKTEEYTPMEIGVYEARVKSIEEDPEGQFGPQVFFQLEILDEDYEGRVLKAWASMPENGRMTPVHKLHGWLSAIRGSVIREGESVSTDELVGKRVMVQVGHKVKDRGTFEKVEGLTPVRRKKPKETEAPKDEVSGRVSEEDFEDAPF